MTKKRVLTFLLAIVMVATLFTGCSGGISETITSEKTATVVGNYAVFQTIDVQEYLDFLENFDETKYEIVDISTSMWTGGYGSGAFYMVTYKTIAE